MKKTLLFVLIAVSALMFQSCKYEDGPSVSCRSKKTRVANLWRLSEMYVNDTLQELNSNTGYSLELTKEGVATTTLDNNAVAPIVGTWEFGDKKETLIMHYPSDNLDPDNVPAEYTILRLADDELWLVRDYDNGVRIDRIESHFITDPSAD
jgi:hypothetical protein